MTPIRLEGDEDDNDRDGDDNGGDTDEDEEDEGSTPVPRTVPRATMCVSRLRFVPYPGSLPSRNL